MTFDEMIDVQKNYRSALGKVEQLHFQDGQWSNDRMAFGII